MLVICGRARVSHGPHLDYEKPAASPTLSWHSRDTRAETSSYFRDDDDDIFSPTALTPSRKDSLTPSLLSSTLLESPVTRELTLSDLTTLRTHQRATTATLCLLSSDEDSGSSRRRRIEHHKSHKPRSLIGEEHFRPKPFDRQRFLHPKHIGKAIYGEITVANDLVLKRKVVIKAVRNEAVCRHRSLHRLENPHMEFSVMRYLHSKTCPVDPLFIATPYALMRDESKTYLVQEYCSGGELYHKLKQEGVFREDKARSIAVQLIFAILSLHSNFICHRDLSMENILISEDRSIRVIDFGQAECLIDENREPKYLTGKAGKTYYRAPEVYYGSYVGGPVDVFALGVIIYILVVGSPPFEDAQPSDCRFRMISGSPDGLHRSLIHENISMPEDLIDFLSAIFFRPPAHRPTPRELLTHRWLTKDLKTGWSTVSHTYAHSELVRQTFLYVNDYLDQHDGQGRLFSPFACLVPSRQPSHEASLPRSYSSASWLWKPARARV